MARFYGNVGYGETSEVSGEPGIYEDTIIERSYFGDILQYGRRWDNPDKVLGEITISNRISVVADAYAYEHFHKMRYVVWDGVYWEISDISVERPRLVLTLGGVYNGPKA